MTPVPSRVRTAALGPAALVLAGLSWCSDGVAQRGEHATTPADRLALLIGIDRYRQPEGGGGWSDLRGCRNDVGRMRAALRERGFEAESIRVLLDEEATHEGILRAFREHLIERAGADTEVLLYFAGHGSRVPDTSGHAGVEDGGMDSTILAHDSRQAGPDRPFDVTDDELYSLLAALCRRTERVTVVTDSCHSGGVVRGDSEPGVRAVGPATSPVAADDLEEVWAAAGLGDVPLLDDSPGRPPLGYVHLAACDPRQQAGEDRFELPDGRVETAGIFTFFLVDELHRLEPGTTYEVLASRVDARMASRRLRHFQRLRLEGNARREVFGGRLLPPLDGHAARTTRAGTIEVRAGGLHLLRAGARLRLLDLDGDDLGAARVTGTGATVAEASWVGEAPALAADTPLRAVVEGYVFEDPPLSVRVPAGDFGDALAARLARAEMPRFDVRRAAEADADYVVGVDGEEVSVRTAAGLELRAAGGDVAAVLDSLQSEARYWALMRLAEMPSTLGVEVGLRIPDEEETARRARELGVPGAIGPVPRRPSPAAPAVLVDRAGRIDFGLVTVRITEAEEPMHVVVLSVSEDRSVRVVHPASGSPGDERLEPGAALEVPIEFFVPEDWPARRPMRDRYLAIVTDRPADFRQLENRGSLAARAREARATTRGGTGALPPALRWALTGTPTRGRSLGGAGEAEQCAVASLDVLVVREGRR